MLLQKLVANLCQKRRLGIVVPHNRFQPTSVSPISRQFASRFRDNDDGEVYMPRQERSFNSRAQFGLRSEADDYANKHDPLDSFFDGLEKPDWDSMSLEEIKKDCYHPHEKTLNRTDDEIRRFREEHEITVQRGAPKPILEFDELSNIPAALLKEIERHGFEKATPIQSQVWPIALNGKNLVGIAKTGSGKTLGFILPAIVHILNQPKVDRRAGPIALVMAPTRELAQQIQEVARQFGITSGVRNACFCGGASVSSQKDQLNRGSQLVISTPGRLLDFVVTNKMQLQQCSYLVLDEADRMLDMGFEPQIRAIVDQSRPDRQTLMFSATWPDGVQNLAAEFLNDFEQVNIGPLHLCANRNIKQIIRICTPTTKGEQLEEIMEEIRQRPADERKTLIFVNHRSVVGRVMDTLKSMGIHSDTIHSGRTQNQRENILNDFRCGCIEVLVATNVAARGLDVDNIQYVINFDYPKNATDYIHRIGRTGRSENTGIAYSLVTEEEDITRMSDLVDVMSEAKQEIEPELMRLAEKGRRLYPRPRKFNLNANSQNSLNIELKQ